MEMDGQEESPKTLPATGRGMCSTPGIGEPHGPLSAYDFRVIEPGFARVRSEDGT